MGLSLSVGTLADLLTEDEEGAQWLREEVETLNAVLARNGLPSHTEPEHFEQGLPHLSCGSFPYSFVHLLRRAHAHVHLGLKIPDELEVSPAQDAIAEAVALEFSSHLQCHSDAEGFYVPISFAAPIFDDALPANILGSSQSLLRELLELAPHLGIALEGNAPTASAMRELEEIDEGPLWREKMTWFAFWEAATLSITHRSLIVFS